MKNILFYGDSNTWGFDPGTTLRYPYQNRWTSVCAAVLGDGYNCIPAGMNGRTTVFDDPLKGSRNGSKGLDYELQTHKPLDMFVVMLGTNDLKYTDAKGSAAGMEELVKLVLSANERYNLSSPVFPGECSLAVTDPGGGYCSGGDHTAKADEALMTDFSAAAEPPADTEVYADALKKNPILLISPPTLKAHVGSLGNDIAESEKFADFYRNISEKCRLHFLDAAHFVEASDIDGVHLGAEGHKILGKVVAEKVLEII